jgi:hypothetical protein
MAFFHLAHNITNFMLIFSSKQRQFVLGWPFVESLLDRRRKEKKRKEKKDDKGLHVKKEKKSRSRTYKLKKLKIHT